MGEIEVDPVRPQALKGSLARAQDMVSAEATIVRAFAGRVEHLRGDQDAVALAGLGEVAADDAFALSAHIAVRRIE